LQAEFVRDQVLAASGLLVEKIGGPSVKPYHPPGLYEQITAGSATMSMCRAKATISIAAAFTPTGSGRTQSLDAALRRALPRILHAAPSTLEHAAPGAQSHERPDLRGSCALPRAAHDARGRDAVDSRLTLGFRLLLARRRNPPRCPCSTPLTPGPRGFANDPAAAKALLAVGESHPMQS